MKRVLYFLTATVFALSMLSCNQEEMDNLQKQIDELKSDQIASIDTQIASIKTSISSLEAIDSELRGYITTLQEQKTALEKADENLSKSISELEQSLANKESALHGEITAAEANVLAQLQAYKTAIEGQISSINTTIGQLQSKDSDLQNQINNLKTYIDGQIQSTKDWASATFVTLEQYNATAEIVAGLQTQITSINTQIQQLSTTIAGVTQEDLNNAINALDESLQGKITEAVSNCNTAIATAKEEITAAYTTAIQTAIASSESSMKNWVNNQLTGYYTISQTDAKLSALKTTLEGQLASQKTYLEGLISSLETTLTRKIEANGTLISNLQTQVNGLSTDLSELAATVATNGRNISQNASDIAANARNIATNASDIDECERLIAANKRLIEANATAIGENASAITALQNRATTDEQNIATNATNIGKNAEDIAANAALIAANATAISNNAQAISDNAAAISQLRTDLNTARTEITAAYQQAISTAITTLDGQLRGKIAAEVETLNGRIDSEVETINATITALTERVATCERDIRNIKSTIYSMQLDIEELQEQVAAILARIQSISFVPKYSDGKAVMTYTNNGTITPGTAEFNFELQPASTAAQLVAVWQTAMSMTAVYTITKAAPETVALNIESVSADGGFLTVVVSGSAMKEAYFKNQCSASVRLKISDGNNERCSEYVEMVPWTTDVISFGDSRFKAYCVENFDTDGDGEITEDEANAVTAINASMLNITSLVGIEYFSNLETIDVSYNKLETLDLSHSPKLKTVDVSGNKLQTLGLSGLSALETLDCSNNKLGTLDVSDALALETLNANSNQLGALNISRNKSLKELQCASNNLTALDFKNNTSLETIVCRRNNISQLNLTKLTRLKMLDCGNNNIASLNIYNNTALESLYCSSNSLSTLSVSANTALINLECASNGLSALDVSRNTALVSLNCSKNNLTSLDVSKNTVLETVNCTDNAGLEKLWVKNAAQAAALEIRKDDITGIFYNDGGIYIPDANLKAYLLALFDDDEDGEISVVESENVQNVNCSGRGIADLTGLECCTNLKYLNFANNSVAVAELPNLKKLETVVAYGNALTRINLNNDIALKALYVNDVNTNAAFGTTIAINGYAQSASLSLAIANTPYTRLEVTNSTALTSLEVTENLQLTELVASGNTNVTSLDVTPLEELTLLDVNACGLTTLDVSHNVDLVTFDCSSNALNALNIDTNTSLVTFDCSDNQLSTLRITNNTVLETADVSDNQLQNLNVRQNESLKTLNVSSNTNITALDVSNNEQLDAILANNTSLSVLDLRQNPVLTTIKVLKNNNLTDILFNDSFTTEGAELWVDKKLNYCYSNSTIANYMIGTIYVDPYDVAGVIFTRDNSGSTAKMISKDEGKASWYNGTYTFTIKANNNTYSVGTYYSVGSLSTSISDGKANMDKIKGMSSWETNFPAFKWCSTIGDGSWYLPASNELGEISEVVISVLNKISKYNSCLSSSTAGAKCSSYTTLINSDTGKSNYLFYLAAYRGGGTTKTKVDVSSSCPIRAVRTLSAN